MYGNVKWKLTIFLLLWVAQFSLSAQSISVYVINTGAGFINNEELGLAYSIGDLAAGELANSEVSLIHIPFSDKKVLTSYTQELPSGEIRIYPNPFQSTVFVEATSTEVRNIRVYNLDGILVRDVQIQSGKVNFGELPSGVYLLKIVDSKEQTLTTLKVIKH